MKSRRKREMERFGDLQRHPWIGERQAGKARGIYANNVRTVDRELALVPYAERLRSPRGGAYPLVQGLEVGTGPHPWLGGTDQRLVARNMAADAENRRQALAAGKRPPPGRPSSGSGPAMPVERNLPVDRDHAAYWDGPHAPPGGGLPLARAEGVGGFARAVSRRGMGAMAGAAAGAQWGAVIPGLGNVAGAATGGALGFLAA